MRNKPYVGITISKRFGVLCLVSLALVGLAFGTPSSAQEDNEYSFKRNMIGHPWITGVTIWSSQPIENDPELISISILDRSPTTSPQLPVIAYLDISAQGLVTHASIEFQVLRSWLEQNYVGENDVVLLRLDGNNWSELPTQENWSDNAYVHYEAQSPGLSVFAISGRPSGQPPTLLGVLLVIAGVVVVSLVYWFMIRPRRMFTSLKKLKHEVGQEKYAPPPAADRELPTKIKKLRKATAPGLSKSKVERLKPMKPKKIEAKEDIAILKQLKKKVGKEESGGKHA